MDTFLPKSNTGAAIGGVITLIVSAVIGAFNMQLGAGKVPIPVEWQWCVPIAGAGITALLAVLTPRVGKE